MDLDASTFRETFPEFGDPVAYPDKAVESRIRIATGFVSKSRWGRLYEDGVLWLAAHYLALSGPVKKSGGATASGPIPAPNGAVASKSLGGASISYDTSVGLPENAGVYGATAYGRQYIVWLRAFGAGGIQL